MDKEKRKINMLSPEEMRNETPKKLSDDWWDWDSGTKAKDPYEACEAPKKFGDHCEWYDDRNWVHYGFCEYDYNKPKLTLVCDEAPGGSGTE